ncbi:Single myb histone 5 [Nymphaea thermarum]|nr:Single myb histone 5 [Nymphaea thermarum]
MEKKARTNLLAPPWLLSPSSLAATLDRIPQIFRPPLGVQGEVYIEEEWDSESIEPLLEKSQSHSRAIHLPSPKKLKISPLQRQDATRYTRRRKIRRWSPFEEKTLRDAVKKCGVGSWKFILNCHPEVFEGRMEIDLKDKWQNMTRP